MCHRPTGMPGTGTDRAVMLERQGMGAGAAAGLTPGECSGFTPAAFHSPFTTQKPLVAAPAEVATRPHPRRGCPLIRT